MPLVQDYIKLSNKWKKEYGSKTCVLMQCGSFFEMYGLRNKDDSISDVTDVEELANVCDILVANKSNKVNGKQVVMAGFGISQIDKYIRRFQENRYTCAIYTETKQGSTVISRDLSEIVSPGTYFGEDNTQISSNAVCVWIKKVNASKYNPEMIVSGISAIDVNTGRSNMYQFSSPYHKDPTSYDDLERNVSISKPHECILVFRGIEQSEAKDISSYIGVNNIKTHMIFDNEETDLAKFSQNAEKQKYQFEVMRRFFPDISPETVTNTMQTHDIALQSYTVLLDFVYQHNPSILTKIEYASIETVNNTLHLGNHSLRQLNIVDDNRHQGKLSSVTNFLDNCKTTMGSRLLRYNLCHPTTDIDKLERIYDCTDAGIKTGIYKEVREALSGVRDIDKSARLLATERLQPSGLYKLYIDLTKTRNALEAVINNPTLENAIKTNNLDQSESLDSIIGSIEDNFDLVKLSHFDDLSQDKLGVLSPNEVCFVKLDKSSEIKESWDNSNDYSSKLINIQNHLSTIIGKFENRKSTRLPVKLNDTPKSAPTIVATSRRCKCLKEHIKVNVDDSIFSSNGEQIDISDIEFDKSGSSKTEMVIRNQYIDTLTKNLQKTREELILNLTRFYFDFCSQLTCSIDKITKIARIAAWLDCFQNSCYVSTTNNYCRPRLTENDQSFVNAYDIRHPLIEHLQTNETYVANDISLGIENDGCLLYGTNAVGKSSLIKSIGIAVVMSQAGLYVPCSKFILSPYHKIYTRILGNDNLFKGLSTFAVEMSELRTILESSDNRSLVIGDELCSGTESNSARSIFTAGVEWLHNKKASFIFATHFHEIVNYDEIVNLERIKMMHLAVTYNPGLDCLIYDRKLRPGPGEDMYGLEVCKSLNLSSEFLSRAHSLRMKYNPKKMNILSTEGSRYNTNKLKGTCEMCGSEGEEIHHLVHQSEADKTGYVGTFHKNHPANLQNVCESCHDKLHDSGQQHRKTKTSKGNYILTASSRR
jgi:DNA mismatch repair protein MutS